MAPEDYLRRVDPEFTRYPDEDSMPWILKTMTDVATGRDPKRFAPLMMDSAQKHVRFMRAPLIGHEGRHRALAAHLLEIGPVPVVVRNR